MDRRRQIKALVRRHPVVLFMKGTPDYPMCEDSARAVEVLAAAEIPFHAVNVQEDPFVRAALPRYANWAGIPQLYVHADLIGGCEVLVDLLHSGELARIAHDLTQVSA